MLSYQNASIHKSFTYYSNSPETFNTFTSRKSILTKLSKIKRKTTLFEEDYYRGEILIILFLPLAVNNMSLCSSCIIVSQLNHTMFVYSSCHSLMHLVDNFLFLDFFSSQSSFWHSAVVKDYRFLF
jgi:hypothetical protein